MRTYDLIFSLHTHRRIQRHLLFWAVVWLFFEFTYFLPYYWYPGWNTAAIPSPVVELGTIKFFFLVVLNSFLAIITLVFFTYMLIYFLLPRYLLKEKYTLFIVLLSGLLFVSAVQFYFEFKYLNPLIRSTVGRAAKTWTFKEQVSCSVDLVLFNCPAIGGVALGITLLKRWSLKQGESQQLIMAKSRAELQLLKAQVHPHFLFNTLNNIYAFTLNASPKAPEMIKQLSGLLHYIIQECDEPLVPLEKELKMIQDYMALEKIRYADQMDMNIDISGNFLGKKIAPLMLIPFVENSFKHGASKMLSKPWVNLNIIIEDDIFYFMLNNSKPEEYISPNQNGGIGLTNVRKRLQLLYPGNHQINITEESQHYTVLLQVNLAPLKAKISAWKAIKKIQDHELSITNVHAG